MYISELDSDAEPVNFSTFRRRTGAIVTSQMVQNCQSLDTGRFGCAQAAVPNGFGGGVQLSRIPWFIVVDLWTIKWHQHCLTVAHRFETTGQRGKIWKILLVPVQFIAYSV
jgi:hypothetical protein